MLVGVYGRRNHHLNVLFPMYQLWQTVQADEYLRSVKALQQWCASSKIYPLVLLHQLVPVRCPPKQQYMARCHGQLEFWVTAPLTNMNSFTHVSITGLVAYKEPRMSNVCVGIELPQLVWPFSSAVWKGQDFQILMMRPVHDPHVKKPFPSMAASRIHQCVRGTADLMGLLSSTCPL